MGIDYSSILIDVFLNSILLLIKEFWYLLILVFLVGMFVFLKVIVRKRRFLKSGITEIDKMSGTEFEKYLQSLFVKQGYIVKHTGNSKGDYGVDLVLEKDERIIAVQAKRSKNYIGQNAIREVYAGKNIYKCNEAFVITNNYFSRMARKLAKTNNVELWDRNKLIKIIIADKS